MGNEGEHSQEAEVKLTVTIQKHTSVELFDLNNVAGDRVSVQAGANDLILEGQEKTVRQEPWVVVEYNGKILGASLKGLRTPVYQNVKIQ